jgi:hypothetical protein
VVVADNSVDATGNKHVHLTEFGAAGNIVRTAGFQSSSANDDLLFDLQSNSGGVFLVGQTVPPTGNKKLFDATLEPIAPNLQFFRNGQPVGAVVGGQSGTANVSINGKAPAGGVNVSLTSSAHVTLPATVHIPEGATEVTTTFSTTPDKVDHTESLSSTVDGATQTTKFGVFGTNIVTFGTPATLKGGTSASVTVTLNMRALSGGYHIDLSPSPNLSSPFSVDIPEGQDHATFTISAPHETKSSVATLKYQSYNASGSPQITITPG